MLLLWLALVSCGWQWSQAQTGMATLHNAMPAVLDAYPERRCTDCDGYVAVERCEDVGRDYLLIWQGRTLRVRAADCMALQDRAAVQADYQARYGRPWLVDIERSLWGAAPVRPALAILIPWGRTVGLPAAVKTAYIRRDPRRG